MMINTAVIGTGAAGDKGCIALARENVIPVENIMLCNSTMQDIENIDLCGILPENIIELRDQNSPADTQGCGKESRIGEELAYNALDNGILDLEKVIKPDTEQVIIVTSLGGGTGCGSSIVIANEIRERFCSVRPIAVRVIGFAGFDTDMRELQNTVSFFKRLSDDFVVDVICNSKFLTAGVTQIKACELANEEFVKKVSILVGNCITPSEFNIDHRDMIKSISRFGYSNVEYLQLTEKVKNMEHFNQMLQQMVDNTTSMDTEKSGELVMAIIINLPKNQQAYIDHSYSVLKNAYGPAFELYEHIECDDSLSPFIAYIIGGMELPIDQVQAIQAKYLEQKEASRTRRRRSFFDEVDAIDLEEDTGFEYGAQRTTTRRGSRRNRQVQQQTEAQTTVADQNKVNPNEGF